MKHDIWKFIAIILAAGVIGFMLGQAVLSMLLACLAIIAWQIYRINLLFKWIENPSGNPMPEVSGQLYSLYRIISRNRNKDSKRKRQLSTFLSQFRKAVSAMPDACLLYTSDAADE